MADKPVLILNRSARVPDELLAAVKKYYDACEPIGNAMERLSAAYREEEEKLRKLQQDMTSLLAENHVVPPGATYQFDRRYLEDHGILYVWFHDATVAPPKSGETFH